MPAAAKPDKKATGKTFLERVLAKVPEEKRAGYADLLANDEILAEVGEHVLMKEDYTRGVQENSTDREKLKLWKGNLDTWYQGELEAKAKLEAEIARLRAGGAARDPEDEDDDEPPAPSRKAKPAAPAVLPTDLVRTPQLEQLAAGIRAEASGYAAVMIPLAARHSKEFDGEVLDVEALHAHCREVGLQIDKGGYDSFVKDAREEKAKKTREKELAEAREAGKQEGLAQGASTAPPGPPTFSGTLSGLSRKEAEKGKPSVVDKAVADYNRRVAQRPQS